jgi:hypothetical protein
MDINFKVLDQARAASRLKHNIKRLNRHDGKTACMNVSGVNISVRIDFGNDIPIAETFKADQVSEINAFCRFLEGSKELTLSVSFDRLGVMV